MRSIVLAVLFLSAACSAVLVNKFAAEVEYRITTAMLEKTGGETKIIDGDDGLNIAKQSGWIISMDDPRSKYKPSDAVKAFIATKMGAPVKSEASANSQGLLELKTDGTIEISLANIEKHLMDRLKDVEGPIEALCKVGSKEPAALYKRTETDARHSAFNDKTMLVDPSCDSAIPIKPTEVQLTINYDLSKLTAPSSKIYKLIRDHMLASGRKHNDWSTDGTISGAVTGASAKCQPILKGYLIMLAYWEQSGGGQKQSLTALPKVDIVDLRNKVHILCPLTTIETRLKTMTTGNAKMDKFWDGVTNSKKLPYNGHAGAFAIVQTDAGISLAIEWRKADTTTPIGWLFSHSTSYRPPKRNGNMLKDEQEFVTEVDDLLKDI